MQYNNKKLVVVAGPTAVGKTSLCIKLAQVFNTDIISADSRQFYRELSIGTAKPTEEEMQGIKHHFIDSHSVDEDYDVGKYETDVLNLLEKLFKEKDVVILTGGSGLYIKAVCEGFDEMPDVKEGLREELNQLYEKKGLQPLVDELKELDPEYAMEVDNANPQRVIRALEVIKSVGKPFSSFRRQTKKVRPFKIVKIGLTREREELYERIDQRVDQMLAQGLLKEATGLHKYKNKNALQTVGYQELFDFLDNQYDYEEAVRLLKRNTRHYAKRQLTWFRKDSDIKWFPPGEEENIVSYIKTN